MNELSVPKREVRIAFVAVVVAMLPAVLDQTILATALPTIAHDLGRLTDVSWVIAAYVVAAIALIVVLPLREVPLRGSARATGSRTRAGSRPLIDELRNTESALARRSRSIGSSRASAHRREQRGARVPGSIRPSAGGVISASPSTIQTFA